MQIAICRTNPEIDLGVSGQGAERLVSSLYGPTRGCREDPGVDVYQERLERMDGVALQSEVIGCARAMHDTFYFPDQDADGRRMLLRTHTSPVQIRTMVEIARRTTRDWFRRIMRCSCVICWSTGIICWPRRWGCQLRGGTACCVTRSWYGP
jgi:hypothetical protein